MMSHDSVGELYSGILKKSPPEDQMKMKRSWRDRYFILQKRDNGSIMLAYFRIDKNRRYSTLLPKGIVDMGTCLTVESGHTLKGFERMFAFSVHTPRRTYFLLAKKETEMRKWVQVICESCGFSPTSAASSSLVPAAYPSGSSTLKPGRNPASAGAASVNKFTYSSTGSHSDLTGENSEYNDHYGYLHQQPPRGDINKLSKSAEHLPISDITSSSRVEYHDPSSPGLLADSLTYQCQLTGSGLAAASPYVALDETDHTGVYGATSPQDQVYGGSLLTDTMTYGSVGEDSGLGESDGVYGGSHWNTYGPTADSGSYRSSISTLRESSVSTASGVYSMGAARLPPPIPGYEGAGVDHNLRQRQEHYHNLEVLENPPPTLQTQLSNSSSSPPPPVVDRSSKPVEALNTSSGSIRSTSSVSSRRSGTKPPNLNLQKKIISQDVFSKLPLSPVSSFIKKSTRSSQRNVGGIYENQEAPEPMFFTNPEQSPIGSSRESVNSSNSGGSDDEAPPGSILSSSGPSGGGVRYMELVADSKPAAPHDPLSRVHSYSSSQPAAVEYSQIDTTRTDALNRSVMERERERQKRFAGIRGASESSH